MVHTLAFGNSTHVLYECIKHEQGISKYPHIVKYKLVHGLASTGMLSHLLSDCAILQQLTQHS